MLRRPIVPALKTPLIRSVPVRARVCPPPKASLQEGVQIVGQYLGFFVLFASTMNWWHYRRIREEIEKNKK